MIGLYKGEESLIYLLPGEVPYIFFKARVLDIIFTNLGMIHVQGHAQGIKRLAKRFNWVDSMLTDVQYETAGLGTDLDVELRFVTYYFQIYSF